MANKENDRISVRLAEASDAEDIKRLEDICFSGPWSKKAIDDAFASENYRIFICRLQDTDATEDEGVAAGYCIITLTDYEAELCRIGVRPEFRRRGIGDRLLSTITDPDITGGGREWFLEVRKSNIAAIELYRKYGFTETGERPDYYTDPKENGISMKAEGPRRA